LFAFIFFISLVLVLVLVCIPVAYSPVCIRVCIRVCIGICTGLFAKAGIVTCVVTCVRYLRCLLPAFEMALIGSAKTTVHIISGSPRDCNHHMRLKSVKNQRSSSHLSRRATGIRAIRLLAEGKSRARTRGAG
jgi:hypothetical protein